MRRINSVRPQCHEFGLECSNSRRAKNLNRSLAKGEMRIWILSNNEEVGHYRQTLNSKIIIAGLFLALAFQGQAQSRLTLEEVVRVARCENLSARRALVGEKNAYWNWQIHKANLRPQLKLDTRLAGFNKGVAQVSQDDGSIAIKSINQNGSSANLVLEQPLPFLGAEIFMNSYLYRFDNFTNTTHSYSSQPIELGLNMPVFAFNQLKWDKLLKPLEYLESRKEYNRELELSAYEAVGMFFVFMNDRHEYSMAEANKDINSELFRIAEEKIKQGRISLDELLQVKLMMVNSQKNLKAARVSMENSALRLLSHLSLSDLGDFIPVIPEALPEIAILPENAIRYALENNPESIAFKRRLLEARQEVAKAKGNSGIGANIFATLGYGSDFDKLDQWQQDLNQHASLEIGLSIPIIDWGRTNAARRQAEMKKELEETSVLQEQINFEKEIEALVNIVMMLKENIALVALADTIAMQRYQIARKRYLAGDISILELNMAQKEKDYASRDLLSTKGNFWVNYYRLRMLTLFDFVEQKALVQNNEQAL
jgi:outer membrane protein